MRNVTILKRAMAMVLCGTMTLVGCSTAWISEAEQIVAALIPAAANILTLVTALHGQSVSAEDLKIIQNTGSQVGADLQLIESLLTAYRTSDAAAQPGLLNQIQTATSAVQSSLGSLLPALHIRDETTQAKVSVVIGLVLSEVESLSAIVPLVNPSASPAMIAMVAKQAKKQPPLTATEFVASYNATITAKTGNAALDDATAGMRIHMHGRFARYASLGILK
ncbi:MAG: hypothetical protein WAN65_00560 [Candidatus Sulfotelmatobacter sp.]